MPDAPNATTMIRTPAIRYRLIMGGEVYQFVITALMSDGPSIRSRKQREFRSKWSKVSEAQPGENTAARTGDEQPHPSSRGTLRRPRASRPLMRPRWARPPTHSDHRRSEPALRGP